MDQKAISSDIADFSIKSVGEPLSVRLIITAGSRAAAAGDNN